MAESNHARSPRRRHRSRLRGWLLGGAVVLVALIVALVAAYLHLNGNIRSTRISRGGATNGDLSTSVPINFLVIGSDTRSSAADCRIGGDCSLASAVAPNGSAATGNADVELLLHLSADRKHAEVVSIPRDTIVDIPACTDPATGKPIPARRDRINSAFAGGPDCQVATVHQLTGLPIAHVAVIDFAGVVTMSNAIGGVQVCVDSDVYDPYSHLKLTKGTHTLQGKAALEFVRTRHAFGNGSDLGREGAQHLFLSAMLRKMTSASTLINPVSAYKLADAATKAITVDNGLAGIDKLVGAAYEFGKVPNKATQFLTMPNIPDPKNPNVVLPAASAATVWRDLVADVPIPSAAPSPSASSASPGPSTSPVTTAQTGAPGGSAAPTTEPAPQPVNASDNTGCAQVSTLRSVTVNGVLMTPAQAFADTPKVPLSAP